MSTDVCVPRTLVDYIAERGKPTAGGNCTGCLAHPAVMSDGFNDYCLPCWTGMHAYDRAEFVIVGAVLGAAVRGALEAGVDERLVRRVVEDALVGMPA